MEQNRFVHVRHFEWSDVVLPKTARTKLRIIVPSDLISHPSFCGTNNLGCYSEVLHTKALLPMG